METHLLPPEYPKVPTPPEDPPPPQAYQNLINKINQWVYRRLNQRNYYCRHL